MKYNWILRKFKKIGDTFIDDTPINGLELEKLQKLFHLSRENPMYDSYPLKKEHVKFFQNYIDEKIEVEKYDYFLECL